MCDVCVCARRARAPSSHRAYRLPRRSPFELNPERGAELRSVSLVYGHTTARRTSSLSFHRCIHSRARTCTWLYGSLPYRTRVISHAHIERASVTLTDSTHTFCGTARDFSTRRPRCRRSLSGSSRRGSRRRRRRRPTGSSSQRRAPTEASREEEMAAAARAAA